MNRKLKEVGASIFALLLLGCTPGKGPFLMVQMCLSNEQGVTQFIQEMNMISVQKGMKFVDSSTNTKNGLDAIGYSGRERTNGSSVINIGVLREDGLGIGASNLGLQGYQVAVGFSEGSSVEESRKFSDEVVERLSQHWKVVTVQNGHGAESIKCD